MSVPNPIQAMCGSWKGTSKLNMPGSPVKECESTLTFAFDPNKCYATVSYVWDEDGPQYGSLLLCGKDDQISGGWSDSWHQSSSVMPLFGKIEGETASLAGHYSVPGYPDWGWRFEFFVEGGNLTMMMFNVSPEGESEWAVEAVYAPA